jgi:hypothetical protein
MDALIKITTFGSALLISYGLARFLVLACVEALLARSFAAPHRCVRNRPRYQPGMASSTRCSAK